MIYIDSLGTLRVGIGFAAWSQLRQILLCSTTGMRESRWRMIPSWCVVSGGFKNQYRFFLIFSLENAQEIQRLPSTEAGTYRLRVRIRETSMAHDNRHFVLEFSDAGGLHAVRSRPMFSV